MDEVTLTFLRVGHTRLTHGPRYEGSRRPSVHTAVSILPWHMSWCTALVTRKPAVCHLHGVISDKLRDNPCGSSNVLAYVTASGLDTMINGFLQPLSNFGFFYVPCVGTRTVRFQAPLQPGQFRSILNQQLSDTISTPLLDFSSFYALCESL
jgi:hypothetical protein